MLSTLTFDAVMLVPISHRNLITKIDGTQTTTLSDGTTVDINSEGMILQASYASGAKVKRNEQYCMVQSADGSFWLGEQGRWHQLD